MFDYGYVENHINIKIFYPTYYLKCMFTDCNTSRTSHFNSKGVLLLLVPKGTKVNP